jgi:hypothetical protein
MKSLNELKEFLKSEFGLTGEISPALEYPALVINFTNIRIEAFSGLVNLLCLKIPYEDFGVHIIKFSSSKYSLIYHEKIIE